MAQRNGDQEDTDYGRIRNLESDVSKVTGRVGILEDWREKMADPHMSLVSKTIFEGDGVEKPSLIALVALIDQKFDLVLKTMQQFGKSLMATVGLVGAILGILIAINALFGPLIRGYFRLPVSYSQPPGVPYTQQKAPQDANLPATFNARR